MCAVARSEVTRKTRIMRWIQRVQDKAKNSFTVFLDNANKYNMRVISYTNNITTNVSTENHLSEGNPPN